MWASRIEDLETPVPLVDIGIVEHNLKKWQARSDKLGIANWPHIKTHKLVALAKAQIELGARGITVQKLGEAEVMADAGITDMLLTFNVVGAHKLERLAALAKRVNISVVADSKEVVEGLAQAPGKWRAATFPCWSNATRARAATACNRRKPR